MRRLFPSAEDDVDLAGVYGPGQAAPGRPWVRLNMVASVDGATAVDGLSGGLGGPADHHVFATLRSLADIILVAAGTMRAEGYGPARLTSALVEARRRRGQPDVPPIAVVTRGCRLDWGSPFFTDAAARPIILTAAAAAAEDRERAAEVADVVLAGTDGVDLGRAIAALADRGARSVLVEGGPTLNGQFAAAGLLDEVCLTLSPRLAGGSALRILASAQLGSVSPLSLASVCEDDGFLFLRYLV